jgi:hypothetical protein
MKKRALLTFTAVLTIVTVCFAEDLISGHWAGKIMGTYDIIYDLKADGNKLTGTFSDGTPDNTPQPITDGSIKGDSVFFTMTSAQAGEMQVRGKVQKDTLAIAFTAMGIDINAKLTKTK